MYMRWRLTALDPELPFVIGPIKGWCAPDCGRRRNATVAPVAGDPRSPIDYTAAKALVQLREELDRRGIGLSAAAIKGKVAKALARYRQEGGLYQLSDYPSVKEALETALAELAKQRAKSSP